MRALRTQLCATWSCLFLLPEQIMISAQAKSSEAPDGETGKVEKLKEKDEYISTQIEQGTSHSPTAAAGYVCDVHCAYTKPVGSPESTGPISTSGCCTHIGRAALVASRSGSLTEQCIAVTVGFRLVSSRFGPIRIVCTPLQCATSFKAICGAR